MSFHLSIIRAPTHKFGPLSQAELKEKLPSVHGFKSVIESSNSAEFRFDPDDLDGVSIFWKDGQLWSERVSENHIPFLSAVALALHARLLGDEGEEYKADGRIIPPPNVQRVSKLQTFLRRNILTLIIMAGFASIALLMSLFG